MKIGINLGGVNYYTTDDPFIDRMRMAQAPNPIAKNIPMPPVDPLTGFPLAAGQLNRQIGLDPASTTDPRNYVLLCDANVASVRTPWGTMIPKDGRATIRITSSAGGVGLGITATGPVTQFAFMRAEHEAAYLAGEVLQPRIHRARRPVPDPAPTGLERDQFRASARDHRMATAPASSDRWLFQRRSRRRPGRICGDAGQEDRRDDLVSAAPPDARCHDRGDCRDFRQGGRAGHIRIFERVRLDLSQDMGLRAGGGEIRPRSRELCRRAALVWLALGQLAKLVSSISPLFQVALSSQASNGASNLPPILKGWDETGSPRSLIAGYANNSYLNLNGILPALLAAMDANDKAGFLAAARTLLPASKLGTCWRKRHAMRPGSSCSSMKAARRFTCAVSIWPTIRAVQHS
jgi:hypothetical protein